MAQETGPLREEAHACGRGQAGGQVDSGQLEQQPLLDTESTEPLDPLPLKHCHFRK